MGLNYLITSASFILIYFGELKIMQLTFKPVIMNSHKNTAKLKQQRQPLR
jgi:hypothetical protein